MTFVESRQKSYPCTICHLVRSQKIGTHLACRTTFSTACSADRRRQCLGQDCRRVVRGNRKDRRGKRQASREEPREIEVGRVALSPAKRQLSAVRLASGRTTISLAETAIRRIILLGEGSWRRRSMNIVSRVPVVDLTAQELVSSALSRFRAGDTISTRAAIDAIRRAAPAFEDSDDHLVELVVMTAIGRTMGVVFDHRSR